MNLACCTRERSCNGLPDDALIVLVAPCNNRGGASRLQGAKLTHVQRLVCGAKQVPVILVNPDLEAMLLTARAGRTRVPPMEGPPEGTSRTVVCR